MAWKRLLLSKLFNYFTEYSFFVLSTHFYARNVRTHALTHYVHPLAHSSRNPLLVSVRR